MVLQPIAVLAAIKSSTDIEVLTANLTGGIQREMLTVDSNIDLSREVNLTPNSYTEDGVRVKQLLLIPTRH